jgi:hypothetical protein
LFGKCEGERPLGRLIHRWEDNIKMSLQEVGCWSMDWIELDQDEGQVAVICDCGSDPSGSIQCGEFAD